jgi:hypothetical protein
MEAKETSDPVDVGLLGAKTVMLEADPGANAVEEARL